MSRIILTWIAVGLAGAGFLPAASPQSPAPGPGAASELRALLTRYCVTCHNERLKTADLMLDKLDVENVPAGAAVWEKVIRKLRTGAMPPVGMPRPDRAGYDSLATYLETELDRAAAAKPNPGRPALHRLNRAEYANAVRDLLALEIDGETLLPADESGYGYDNNADVLSVSPLLLERYVSAARKIARLAMGDPAIRPDSQRYNVSELLVQTERMSEDLPFGSRGGIAFRHHFPVDAEYTATLTLQKSESPLNLGAVIGLSDPHEIEVRVDGLLVKRLTIGGQSASGSLYYVDGKPTEADAGLEVRFTAKAGARTVGVAFVNEVLEDEAESEVILRPPQVLLKVFRKYQDGEPLLQSVTISGPYNTQGPGDTPSRRRIFTCRPAGGQSDEPCARKILSTLARRAYRRPVTPAEVQTLLRFYRAGRSNGGFEAGLGMALRRMLVAQDFLFRAERDPAKLVPGGSYRISDLALASRLSFFLWSSIPDDELLELAERGKLKEPAVLEQQVRRMLHDSRSKALAGNFFGQWLQLRSLRAALPDIATFPDFDENLRKSFAQEADLFFESALREDRSVLDLLNANYTFINDRLARHYGIPNVYGSHFRRVTLSDENRWGLLGKGAVLMLTSHPNRNSPVLRGKYVLENVMGSPPPPPPPDVPGLPETGADGKVLTVRQLMEQHRANPVCASCHARMDPLGFALDNFDPIGRWRTTEANAPIDASGALPDGTKFQGPAELRKILMSHPEHFVTTVTENLLTYALGRGVEYHDQPAVRDIMRKAAPSNHRWSSVILGIVKSVPFQMRRSAEPAATARLR